MPKFLDKILGKGEYKDARDTIERVEALGKRPKGKMKREHRNAQRLLRERRLFLLKTVSVLGGLTVGGGLLLKEATEASDEERPNLDRDKDPDRNPEAEESEIDRREILEEWLNPLRKIAEKMNDPEVTKILEFIEQNGSIVKPDKRGVKFVEGGKSENWFALLALTEEDARRFPFFRKYITFGSGGHYLPDHRSLILKAHAPLTPVWQGIILAHEGFHAYENITTPYNWHDKDEYVEHEVAAHTFENKIVMNVGGEEYQKWLKERVNEMRGYIKQMNGEVFKDFFISRTKYYPVFDEIFGKAKSKAEKDLRGTHAWIHATFTLIDEDYPEKAHELKKRFLDIIYQRSGLDLY